MNLILIDHNVFPDILPVSYLLPPIDYRRLNTVQYINSMVMLIAGIQSLLHLTRRDIYVFYK